MNLLFPEDRSIRRMGPVIALILLSLVSITLAAHKPAAQAGTERETAGQGGDQDGDLGSIQQYWALRRGNVTPAVYRSARAHAGTLPKSHALPGVSRGKGGGSRLSTSASSSSAPIAASSSASSTTWQPLGPSPVMGAASNYNYDPTVTNYGYSGRIQAVAVDPTTSGATTVIYIGSANGGVWKSSDNGGHWTPLTDSQSSLAIGALAIDPNNHTVIYAGTGEPDNSIDSYLGDGVLKSTDAGATWTLEGASVFNTNQGIGRIIVNPHNSAQVFAAGAGGLYVSNDSGVDWSLVSGSSGLPTAHVDDLAANTATSTMTLYASVRSNGLYRSTDGGTTWTLLGSGVLPAGASWNRAAVAVAPSNPQEVYVVVSNSNSAVYQSGGYNGGYYSTDGGTTWTTMSSLNLNFAAWAEDTDTTGQAWYDLWLAVDPHNDDIVYAGGVHVAMSLDARASSGNWEDIMGPGTGYIHDPSAALIHADQHAMAFVPGCAASPCPFYAGNDGGIFENVSPTISASTYTPNWTDLNSSGIAITEYNAGDLGTDFTADSLALGGTQDNGTTLDSPPLWQRTAGGDGGYTAVDWSNPATLYSEYYDTSVIKSTDGGASWNDATSGLPSLSLFYAPFTSDRTNTQHLVWGGGAVYESSNGASSWYQSSQTFSSNCSGAPGCVSAVEIAPSNSAVIYAGTEQGKLYRTTTGNAGTQQTYVEIDGGAFGTHFISGIAVDPSDPNIAYVALGTYCQCYNNAGYVYLTTNGGTSWTNMTGSLPPYPVNSVVEYHSGSARVVVIGTDYGVYYTTNDGGTWYDLNNGLPNVSVIDLSIDQAQTTLVAWTHGRSAWATSLGSLTQTMSLSTPASTTAGSPFSVTVSVTDSSGNPYTGTVHVSSDDAQATLPADYTFTAADAGSHTFSGVILASSGTHTITASDAVNALSNSSSVSVSPATVSPTSIAPGWNLISVPVQSGSLTTLSGLVSSLNGTLGTGSITVAATYGNGRFSLYVPGYSTDQTLSPSQGIFVDSIHAGTGSWSPSGTAYSGSQPVLLRPGWNLVAAPYPLAGMSAGSMASEIDSTCSSGACTVKEIAAYSGGAYTTYIPGSGATPFAVSATSGIWIEMGAAATWTPH